MRLEWVAKATKLVAQNSVSWLTGEDGDHVFAPDSPVDPTANSGARARFLERNRSYWRRFHEPTDRPTDEYVLIDATASQEKSTLFHCSIGNYVAEVMGLRPLYLVTDADSERLDVCTSFRPGEFVAIGLESYRNQTILQAAKDFIALAVSLDDVEAFIDLKLDGMPLGDLAYSTAMRKTGDGTFASIETALYKFLLRGLLYYHQSEFLYDTYDVGAGVISHPWFLRGGVFARNAIHRDIPCFHPTATLLQKFESMDEIMGEPGAPSVELFEQVLSDHRTFAAERGEDIVAGRLGVHPNDVARGQSERERTDEEDGRPTVLIMPHIFIEHLRYRDRLFQDFLTWYREVLEFAGRTPHVDWRVKPHPNRDIYDMNQNMLAEVSRVNETCGHTIDVVPDDRSTKRILMETDVVLTMDGTAGLEYSCFGIPVVLASESPYSDFGFAHKPDSVEEYFDLLSRADELGPLPEGKVERAKVACYIYFDLIRDPWPDFPADEFSWDAALSYIDRIESNETDLRRKIETLVNSDRRHIYELSETMS